MSILGTRVVRTEDALFLTRGATYTDDLVDDRLTGALHATFVRSQVAHGRVLSVDASAARQADGVVAVYTAEDVDLAPIPPGRPTVPPAMTRPWLAGDTVRFVGDLIAVVLTEEHYQGEDAAELVSVDIDPLPAVVTTADALADEVLVFPEAGTNTMAVFGEPAPADFFDGCEVVVRQAVVNQRVAPVPLETRAAAAAWGEDGRVTIFCSNQGAQQAKAQIAGWLGLDPAVVHLVTPDVGGGFGAKIGADPEFALVAWLARKTGRPVKWVESRSENLVGMLHGRGQDQVVAIGGRRDGTVQAYSLVVDQDCHPDEGPLCACGARGCLAASASGRALVRRLREEGLAAGTARDAVGLAVAGEARAIVLLREAGLAVGDVLSTAVSLLNPQALVVGGELVRGQHHFLGALRERLYQRTQPTAARNLQVVASVLDDRAGVVGAARLVIEQVFAADAVDRALAGYARSAEGA